MPIRPAMLRSRSIRTHILALMLAVIGPAAALIMLTESLYFHRELVHEQDDLGRTATRTAESIARDLGETRQTMARLAALPGISSMDPRTCGPVLEILPRLDPRVEQIALRGLDGRLYCSNRPQSAPYVSASRPWFARSLQSQTFSASNAWHVLNSGHWVSQLTYPVRNVSGEQVGKLALPVDLFELAHRDVASNSGHVMVWVLGSDGRVLMRAHDQEHWIGKPFPDVGLDAARMRMLPGPMRFHDAAGEVFMRAAAQVPGTDWVVVALETRDHLRNAALKHVAPVLWTGAPVIAFIMMLAFFMTRRIARPIREIGAAAATVSAGDNQVRIAPSGPTELQVVAREFNRMLEARVLVDRETHEHYKWASKLIENASDMTFIVGKDGKIKYASPSIAEITGFSHKEMLGHSYVEFIHDADIEHWMSCFSMLPMRGRPILIPETRFRHKEGGFLPVETMASDASEDPTLGGYVVNVRNLTERKQSVAALERMRDFYQLLSETNQTIVRKKCRKELFSAICRVAVEHAHVRFAAAVLLDGDGPDMRVAESYGDDAGYLDNLSVSASPDEPAGLGPIGTAVRTGEPVVSNDLENDPTAMAWREAARSVGVHAVAAFPLRLQENVIGVLYFCSNEHGFFVHDIIPTLEQMAMDVSFALENYQREEERKVARHELQLRSTMLRTQLETSLDAILAIDGDMRITSYNSRFIELWDVPAEIVSDGDGQGLLEWISGQVKHKRRFLKHLHELNADEQATGREDLALKDGRTMTHYSAPVVGADGHYYGRVWYFRDITERKKAQAALAESEARYRRLVEQDLIGIYIIRGGCFLYVNPHLEQLFGYETGELKGRKIESVIDPDDRALVRGNIRKRMSGEVETLQYSFKALRKDGTTFTAGVQGSISTMNGHPAIFGLLRDISERVREEELGRKHLAEMESAMLGTIEAVSTMVEMRDPYTAGHERRVSEIAAAIGHEMELSEDGIRVIRMAASLHDIGKISCPAEILVKPTKLTAAEYEIVKSHPVLGYDILKTIHFPWPIADIVLQHHERYDGSGYPNGLKGEETLVEARIVAVADTVESMVSHRPYRPARGIDKALEEITLNRGIRYDPDVVDACLRLFNEKGYHIPD